MIEVRNLDKSFGTKRVLHGTNLTISPGESLAVIGQSGCGKSVLLKHFIGLLKPDAGEVIVEGEDIWRVSQERLYEIREKFGILFQAAALFDSMTVSENISLGLREHTSMDNGEIERRVADCLAMVGLPGTEDLKPAELSGGMKKRVGLARAIAMKPKYVLYDEPTTGLDPIAADAINDLIIRLNEQLKVTTVVVTHDIVSTYKVADRIVMLHDGKIIYSGTPAETRNTDNPIVRQFIEGHAEGPIKTQVSEAM
jgi:phospholipid/cholesterol/gamma-HCH transport system ATP-binding protein